MFPFRLPRRAGSVGLALTAYDIWRRLPAAQRRQLLQGARKHGPRLASAAAAAAVQQAKARKGGGRLPKP